MAVSHQPILPPAWAMLPSDTVVYARAKPLRRAPELVPLDRDARCSCGLPQDTDGEVTTATCIIFTLTEACEASIELQPCTRCPRSQRRHVGPDCRELGIFNYDNRLLFSHDLLDEYTMAYTSSETPFVAWVSVVSRRYQAYAPKQGFVSEDTFRAVWFAYSNIQLLSDDMACPKCGPYPEDTIWDGVTLAFNKKHLLPTLRPPTMTHSASPIRHSKYMRGQLLVLDASLRKAVRQAVSSEWARGARKEHDPIDEDEEAEDEEGANKQPGVGGHETEQLRRWEERILMVKNVSSQLNAVNRSLGNLFDAHFGLKALEKGVDAPRIYMKLFRQVSTTKPITLHRLTGAADCC